MKVENYTPEGFAERIFRDRYAIHPEETFEQACERVARVISDAEVGVKREEYFDRFLDIMRTNRFSPGGRIWRGAGRPRGQMLNCFVYCDEKNIDSREGWGDVLRAVTIISGTGGGVGINFSKIRPRGAPIRGTGGEATGAVSLMRAVVAVCGQLREGGGRRSAMLFSLRYDHPDLLEFMEAKLENNELCNANMSVLIDNEFLKLLDDNQEIVCKWQGEEYGRISAQKIWNTIIRNSWSNGDPGLLNYGLANKMNTISYVCDLLSTNPCGEQWLSHADCCNLGSVNLHSHIVDGKMDWDLLEETVAIGVRFLDNVLDQNTYPLPEIQELSQRNRRIGLGVMGLHDMLIELGLKYSSQEARDFVDKVMSCIKKQAYHASIRIAIEKGSFHAFDAEQHVRTGFAQKCLTRNHRRLIKEHGIRNCALLCIAPTGTTSIVAGCSSGIEPLFQPIYKRYFNKHKDMHNEKKRDKAVEIVAHPLLIKFIKDNRSVEHFQGAHDISPEEHLMMQVVCQKHIDNSISKTINISTDFSVDQLSKIMRKYINKLKGITVYRDGSRGKSPLTSLSASETEKYLGNIKVEAAVGDCPNGVCDIETEKGGS